MSDAGELVRKWLPAALEYQDEAPDICQDCGNRTDLGHKCRACYALWKRLLWQDIPKELAKFKGLARELNKMPNGKRDDIATLLLGGSIENPLGASHAACLKTAHEVLGGPFGAQLRERCQAIKQRAGDEPKRSRRAMGEVD